MTKRTKQTKQTALAKWDDELARQAEAAAQQEASISGGQFFSLRGGVLKLNDAPIPNNEMAVVIIDSLIENVFYAADFDADNLQSPNCYAFGRNEDSMAPHEDATDAQSDSCVDCEKNQWGSATRGRGKACRNRRRLAVLPAGTLKSDTLELYNDEEHYAKAPITYLALPPTSLSGYGSWVKQIAGALKRPPHGVVAKVAVIPDNRTQFKVTFETLDFVPNELLGVIMRRHEESQSTIDFPYPRAEERAPPPPKKRKARKY